MLSFVARVSIYKGNKPSQGWPEKRRKEVNAPAYYEDLKICQRLELDKDGHGVQTTKDGRFGVEYVECLASCGTAPRHHAQ